MVVKKRNLGVFVLLLIAVVLGEAAQSQDVYRVDGGPLRWVLEGQPSPSNLAQYVEFRLIREGAEPVDLNFSLSALVDDLHNEFPRELLALRTPYDSEEQQWDLIPTEKCLLAAADEFADLQLGVYYTETVAAGTYTGSLRSDAGGEIPLEIVVKPFTAVVIDTAQIKLEALGGPGIYRISEPIQVCVRANHSNWVARFSSPGLLPVDDLASVSRPLASWEQSSERTAVPVPLLFIDLSSDQEAESGSEVLQVTGAEYGWQAIIEFTIQARVGWEHPAGEYVGVIRVDLEEVDE